jgi:hypothetical protein
MNDGKGGLGAREARHDGGSNAGIVMELMQTSLFDILYRKPVAWHLHEQLQVLTRSSTCPYVRMHACTHASHSSSSSGSGCLPPGLKFVQRIRSVDLKVLRDVADGLLFLHTRRPPIVHADVKSPNVLLDETGASRHVLPGLGHVRPGPGRAAPGSAQYSVSVEDSLPYAAYYSAACRQPLGAWGTSPVVCCTLHVARCPVQVVQKSVTSDWRYAAQKPPARRLQRRLVSFLPDSIFRIVFRQCSCR